MSEEKIVEVVNSKDVIRELTSRPRLERWPWVHGVVRSRGIVG
jgi:hypothetical protein